MRARHSRLWGLSCCAAAVSLEVARLLARNSRRAALAIRESDRSVSVHIDAHTRIDFGGPADAVVLAARRRVLLEERSASLSIVGACAMHRHTDRTSWRRTAMARCTSSSQTSVTKSHAVIVSSDPVGASRRACLEL